MQTSHHFDPPATDLKCGYCAIPSYFIGQGSCSSGVCTCQPGFSGPDCQFDQRDEPTCVGALGPDGECCRSGLFSVSGQCCGRDQLDAMGECCEEKLDACGVCGGNGLYVDAVGRCCEVIYFNLKAGSCDINEINQLLSISLWCHYVFYVPDENWCR